MKDDTPLLVRGSCDLILFTISALYIIHNRRELYRDERNKIALKEPKELIVISK
jgi:hypothetical protein